MIPALFLIFLSLQGPTAAPEIVSLRNENLTLRGVLYEPAGPGPFPAVLYNHGSAPGMLNSQAFEQLGPLFASRGWVFFAPYRRGQGLSAAAGPFIGDEISAARNRGRRQAVLVVIPLLLLVFIAAVRRRHRGLRIAAGAALGLVAVFAVNLSAGRAGAAAMVRLLETEHLSDQLAAVAWLQEQALVDRERIATAGNSFGGVEAVLGAERFEYCAAIDASGGAESWAAAPRLREVMKRAVRNSRAPILFFQAANDYDLSPSRSLSAEMIGAGKASELKIYPPYGASAADGHRFAWAGSAVWADDVFRFLEVHCAR